MSFTYKLTSADLNESIVSKLRLEIGDESENRGVKPDGTNFADEELLFFYEEEGSVHGRAVAKALEVLAAQWSRAPRTMFGSLVDPRHIAKSYRATAGDLRLQHGYESSAVGGFSVSMKQYESTS
jgi:hypothetical protein